MSLEKAKVSSILESDETHELLRDTAKRQPLSCQYGLGIEKFDAEGRQTVLEYKDYYIINVYAPNLNPHSIPDCLDFRKLLKANKYPLSPL